MRNRFLVMLVGFGTVLALPPAALRAAEGEDGAPQRVGQTHIIFTDEGKPIKVFRLRPDADASVTPMMPKGGRDGGDEGDDVEVQIEAGFAASGGNLSYHGGPVIITARETSLFWGNWSGSDVPQHMTDFFGQFGMSGEYQVITQYYGGTSTNKIQLSNLGGFNRFDTSTPPSTVTDTAAQQEIAKNFQNGNLGTPDASTVYFLYLPNGVTSTIGGSSSCTAYCGYHSNFTYNGTVIKYAVMPYPSCTGCQGNAQSGLSIQAASLTIVSGHELREAATDSLGTAWYDRRGYEADDKCAWQLFIDGTFQHQKEWSNAKSGCVMKGINGP